MSKGRVLVTGVSGFLGGHVALAALNAGYDVRGSVRNLARREAVTEALARAGADVSRLDFCALDLTRDDGWADAMEGVDFLAHTASPFIVAPPKDPSELIRPAVEGTRRAVKSALDAGVKAISLTSSFVAVGYGAPAKTGAYDANDWTQVKNTSASAYYDSKTLAEKEAWRLAEAAGRREALTAVNPTAIMGPALHDDLSESVVLVARMMKGEFPMAPKLWFGVIDVRDVAEMHIRAFDGDIGGQRMLMADKIMSVLEVARAVAAACPEYARKLPKREAPNFMIRLMALFDSQVAGVASELGKVRRLDCAPALAALGRDFIPAEEAIGATAKSLIELGAV